MWEDTCILELWTVLYKSTFKSFKCMKEQARYKTTTLSVSTPSVLLWFNTLFCFLLFWRAYSCILLSQTGINWNQIKKLAPTCCVGYVNQTQRHLKPRFSCISFTFSCRFSNDDFASDLAEPLAFPPKMSSTSSPSLSSSSERLKVTFLWDDLDWPLSSSLPKCRHEHGEIDFSHT